MNRRSLQPGRWRAVAVLAAYCCAPGVLGAWGALAVSRKDLFEAYGPAVVGIEVSRGAVPVASGAGFFISRDGKILVGSRLVIGALLDEKFALTFFLPDGTSLKDYQVAGCGTPEGLEACVLRISHRPRVWFKEAQAVPVKGARAFLLGHGSRGYAFSNASVIEAAPDAGPLALSPMPTSAQYGCAIFNEDGGLWGMVGTHSAVPAVLPARRLFAFAGAQENFRKPKRFGEDLLGQHRLEADALGRRFALQAYQLLENGQDVSKLLKTKVIFFTPAAEYRGFLPDLGWQCSKAPGRLSPLECVQTDPILGPLARFGVRVSKWNSKKSLLETNAGAKPGVCALRKEGPFKGMPACSRESPARDSTTLTIQDGGALLEFTSWSRDRELHAFYGRLPELFGATVRDLSASDRSPAKPRFDENWLKP